MKKALFICILSLSVCLSHAAPSTGTDEHTESTTNTTKGKNEIVVSPVTADKNTTTLIPSSNNTTTKAIDDTNATTATTEKTNDNNSKQTVPTATTAKSSDAAVTTTKATTTVQTTTSKVVTTTQHAITEKPTEASKTEKPTLAARGFDSPSFFGGIVLTLGLLAIGFMGFKYYKNQTERNYHTL